MSRKITGLLPQVPFSILFALSLEPRHGYDLITQIRQDSVGKIIPGPGSLYGSIKQLREDNLIEEMPFEGNSRRRYYRLTIKGLNRLNDDLKYFQNTVVLAHDRRIPKSKQTHI